MKNYFYHSRVFVAAREFRRKHTTKVCLSSDSRQSTARKRETGARQPQRSTDTPEESLTETAEKMSDGKSHQQQQSLSLAIIVLFALCHQIPVAQCVELTFELPDNAKECFHEEIQKNQTAALEFQVRAKNSWCSAMITCNRAGAVRRDRVDRRTMHAFVSQSASAGILQPFHLPLYRSTCRSSAADGTTWT